MYNVYDVKERLKLHLCIRMVSRLRQGNPGVDLLLLHAYELHHCIMVLRNERAAGCGRRLRSEVLRPEHEIRRDPGSTDR